MRRVQIWGDRVDLDNILGDVAVGIIKDRLAIHYTMSRPVQDGGQAQIEENFPY